MILASLRDSARIESLHRHFPALFRYLREHDLSSVPAGRIVLDGEELFINVCDAELKTREEQKLEVHRQYIDVHIPLSGTEVIGWRDLGNITEPSEQPFCEENDFALYALPATTYVEVQPGEMLIVYPEDAHAPIIGKGVLRKLIVKVKI